MHICSARRGAYGVESAENQSHSFHCCHGNNTLTIRCHGNCGGFRALSKGKSVEEERDVVCVCVCVCVSCVWRVCGGVVCVCVLMSVCVSWRTSSVDTCGVCACVEQMSCGRVCLL